MREALILVVFAALLVVAVGAAPSGRKLLATTCANNTEAGKDAFKNNKTATSEAGLVSKDAICGWYHNDACCTDEQLAPLQLEIGEYKTLGCTPACTDIISLAGCASSCSPNCPFSGCIMCQSLCNKLASTCSDCDKAQTDIISKITCANLPTDNCFNGAPRFESSILLVVVVALMGLAFY